MEQSHQINNHSVDVKKVIIKQDQKPMNRGRMNKGFGGSNNGRNSKLILTIIRIKVFNISF